jgi:hypothetical protein
LKFSNLGRSKAFPLEIRCGWTIGNKLPDMPIYTFSKPFGVGFIFEPEPKVTPALNINEAVIEDAPGFYDRVRDGTSGLWFYCSFAYLDFMQNRHEVGFCWKRYETFGKGGFIADATPAYNQKT